MSIAAYRRTTNEAAMRDAIAELVSLRGGRMFYLRDSRSAPEMEDWPDLHLILPHKRTVAHVELKSQRRIVTPGQAVVLALLQECDRAESFVVRTEPRDETETSYDAFLEWLA